MKILLKNCRSFYYEPLTNEPKIGMICIEITDKKITAITTEVPTGKFDREIDCFGLEVLPGGIDPHVHMSCGAVAHTKGVSQMSADTFLSGSEAAIAGGTTSIIDFTGFSYFPTAAEMIQQRMDTMKKDGGCYVDYAFHLTLVKAEQAGIVAEGAKIARSFKLFTVYKNLGIDNSKDLFTLIQEIAKQNRIAMVHCENHQAVTAGIGRGLPIERMEEIRPPWNELEATARILTIAELTGCSVHIAHVSLPEAVEIIRFAKERMPQPLTCEVTTHHMQLNNQLYETALFKEDLVMSPPLQAPEAMRGMQKALVDNKVDFSCSDHCPYTRSQRWGGKLAHQIDHVEPKSHSVMPNGTNGIQIRYISHYSILRAAGCSLEHVAKQVAQNAADRYQLPFKGRIAVGYDADLVVIDPYKETVFSLEMMKENLDASLFEGKHYRGLIKRVFVRGLEYGVDKLDQGRFMYEGGCK